MDQEVDLASAMARLIRAMPPCDESRQQPLYLTPQQAKLLGPGLPPGSFRIVRRLSTTHRPEEAR